MNVAHWLNAIDFETVFREHEIAAGALRDLVEADLKRSACRWGTASVSSRRSPL